MSTITIVNNADNYEVVRVAIYWRPVGATTLNTIAWRVVSPPPGGGQTVIAIPDNFGVYANYPSQGDDPNDPNAGNRTPILSFNEYTARFVIGTSVSQDSQVTTAAIAQVYTDLVLNEVRIDNDFSNGVWTHITKDGDDIYAPQVVWPGAVRIVDIRPSLNLAIVSPSLSSAGRLADEVTTRVQTSIHEGETATVLGSMWKGYSITVT
jgi:hypothetical protein